MNEEDVIEVIDRLYPEVEFTCGRTFGEPLTLDCFEFLNGTSLSQEELEICEAEFASNEYARKRKQEFITTLNPTIQADMRYHDDMNGTTTLRDAITAIKNKWPKDNSGPIE